jgi:hypothetical protein
LVLVLVVVCCCLCVWGGVGGGQVQNVSGKQTANLFPRHITKQIGTTLNFQTHKNKNKQVQTIGLISHLRANGIYGPFMILGPLSVLPNWVSEVERWCPSQPVILYHGNKQERAELRARHMPTGAAGPDFPLIVTSFEIVMADIKPLSRYSYKYVVVDEGHRLKNSNCRLLRELRTLDVQNKLLLTGALGGGWRGGVGGGCLIVLVFVCLFVCLFEMFGPVH